MLFFKKKIVIPLFFLLCSCEKFLEVGNPPDKVTAQFVYSSNGTAAAVLTGIYYDLQNLGSGIAQGSSGITVHCGLFADEFNTYPLGVYSGASQNSSFYDFWTPIYQLIYRTNAAIEGLSSSTTLSLPIKHQLLGEAQFLRAFFYFYLINLYGDVPLLTTTSYKENYKAGRVNRDEVYEQIIKDLLTARELMSSEYLGADAFMKVLDRTRPNKWCANALLARVYLYTKKWNDAESMASEVIGNKELYDTTELLSVFLKNSKEAIWQLESSVDGWYYTRDARLFTLINGRPDAFENPIWVSSFLLSAFEIGDHRKNVWINVDSSSGKKFEYFSKYKVYQALDTVAENLMVLRIGEQLLIRAEARAQSGNIEGALHDLNLIRRRAHLPELSFMSKELLLDAILQERKVELFCEWGHRWFDLKRCEKINDVMNVVCPLKGGVWSPYKQLLPVPVREIRLNDNIFQNDGYPSS